MKLQDQLRIELLKVIGKDLDRCYALVNIDINFEEWRGRILEWDGRAWRLIYKDNDEPCLDFALMPDNSIIVSRDDGKLVILRDNTAQIIQTRNKRGCATEPISDTEVLIARYNISKFNINAMEEELLGGGREEWIKTFKFGNRIYIAGVKKRIAVVENDQIAFLSVATTKNLSSIVTASEGNIIIGGWKGLVQRQVGKSWEDISIDQTEPVTGLAMRDATLVACLGGVYTLVEATKTWKCEIEPAEKVWALTSVADYLVACHTYTGNISIWDRGGWRRLLPSVTTTNLLG